jgi:N6-L-threonylcarbamoyladenine synthase
MRILGIETSCDETAAAIVEGELKSKLPLSIKSSVVASSAELHIKYGGILPEQAARQQVLAMTPVLIECFEKAGMSKEALRTGEGIDAIAITCGPGLVGSLLVGVETAKTLALLWKKPIIKVNHLVAHLYANWLETGKGQGTPLFPGLGLIVSGGHTDMVLFSKLGNMTLVGSTRDDAAGECFDKSARMLGLPYPGGPEIAKLADVWLEAEKLKPQKERVRLDLFPRPLADRKTFDWSFSGLKTSVLYKVKSIEAGKAEIISRERLAAEVQEAICDSLMMKLEKAVAAYAPKSVLVAGGVAANKRFGEKLADLAKDKEWSLFVPPPKVCTDNGSYIAAFAFYHYSPTRWQMIDVQPGLTILG